jgi:hypothetical protein
MRRTQCTRITCELSKASSVCAPVDLLIHQSIDFEQDARTYSIIVGFFCRPIRKRDNDPFESLIKSLREVKRRCKKTVKLSMRRIKMLDHIPICQRSIMLSYLI